MSADVLVSLRHEISEIDSEILILLAKRRRLSHLVVQEKVSRKKPIRDIEREEALLVKLIGYGQSLGLDSSYVTRVFQTIIEDSVLVQQAILQNQLNDEPQGQHIAAFLGGSGAYSQLATQRFFAKKPGKLIEMGLPSFNDIVKAVESGQADYGVLPIENTSSGSINEVYDLLQHTRLHIVGEINQPVEHCLVGKTDIALEQISHVYGHPQAHAQCSYALAQLGNIKAVYCSSTADALSQVQASSEPGHVAIASEQSARLFELLVLKSQIANQTKNYSRFIVVSRRAVKVAPLVPAKLSLTMITKQHPGALVDALLVLKQQRLNLLKLESRPIPGTPWEEMFYVDLAANIQDKATVQALDQLQAHTETVRILGCYPSEIVAPALSDTPASDELVKG